MDFDTPAHSTHPAVGARASGTSPDDYDLGATFGGDLLPSRHPMDWDEPSHPVPLPIGLRIKGLRKDFHHSGPAFGGDLLPSRLLRGSAKLGRRPVSATVATRPVKVARDLALVECYKTLERQVKMPMWHPVESLKSIRERKARAAIAKAVSGDGGGGGGLPPGLAEPDPTLSYQEQNARYMEELRTAAAASSRPPEVLTGAEIQLLSAEEIQREWSEGGLELDAAGKAAMYLAMEQIQTLLATAGLHTPGTVEPDTWLAAVAAHPHLSIHLVRIAFAMYKQTDFGAGTQAIGAQTILPSLAIYKSALSEVVGESAFRYWLELYRDPERGWFESVVSGVDDRRRRAGSRIRSLAAF